MTLQELITALQEIATTQSPALPTNVTSVFVDTGHWRVVRVDNGNQSEIDALREEVSELHEELHRAREL